jgi:hypothetical protein
MRPPRAYREVIDTDHTRVQVQAPLAKEVEDLKLQVRNLERLIGQRTREIARLKKLLGEDQGDES